MDQQTIDLVFKIDDMPKKQFSKLFGKFEEYEKTEIDKAAKLVDQMLKWNPKERITAEKALKDPFFK